MLQVENLSKTYGEEINLLESWDRLEVGKVPF